MIRLRMARRTIDVLTRFGEFIKEKRSAFNVLGGRRTLLSESVLLFRVAHHARKLTWTGFVVAKPTCIDLRQSFIGRQFPIWLPQERRVQKCWLDRGGRSYCV